MPPIRVCLLLAVDAIASFFYLQHKYRDVSSKGLELSLWPPPEHVRWLLLGIILLFCLVSAGNQLYWVITNFGNPEYYAFHQLPFTK